jgi:hypothetical protein
MWEFARGVWQYDVMVAAILAFIFLTPRSVFRDQPKPENVVMLSPSAGSEAYWLGPELLQGVPEADRPARATEILKTRSKRPAPVVKLEPIFDEEKEIKGFMAYTAKP